MYSINFKHRGSTTEYALYRPGDDDYCLTAGKLNLEMGKAGELTLSLPITNPAVANIVCLTDEVIVYRDAVELWRGRPVTSQKNFQLTGTLACEGCLAYLYDTYYPPFEYSGSITGLLSNVVDNHNSFVSEDKRFTVGNVTVADPNNYIARSSEDYMRTIEVLSSRFVGSSLGGYFRVRVVDGVKYLDYLSSYGTTASQDVLFGQNILDLASKIEYGNAITAVLPLGARREGSGRRVTVESVNSGSPYVADENLVAERGFICESAVWDDVTTASALLERARTYLSQASAFVQTFTVKAIDLQWEDASNKAWVLGDSVRVRSEPHNVNQYSELYKMSLDLLNPTNDTYDFGITRTNNSLAGKTASSQRNIQDSLSSLAVNFHKISADYATFDYLSANFTTTEELEANYTKTNELEAKYATIERLDADEVNINNAIIGKADVGALNAVKEDVEDLNAVSANVKVLLAGQAVTGDMQTIKLTADNAEINAAAIDIGTIRTLLSQNITVADLLAGKISTDKFTVGSADGTFDITKSVLTIKDKNNKTRIQLGKDTQDNFTFILYDEDGEGVLIDSTGIKASAIADGLIVNDMVADDAAIEGTKLDIASVINALDTGGAFKASRIHFDEGTQTLEQAYSAIKQEVSKNTEAIKGISSLDNLTSILSNDAHVVHTDMNGDGGDFTNAITQVSVYKGDLDVTNDAIIQVYPSANVTGTWDASTKTYHVTGLTGTDGYVDFDTAYGVGSAYLTTPDGEKYATRSGNELLVPIAAHVHKRFSISKALDGRVGVSYRLQTSASVIKRDLEDKLNPSDVTFSAIYSDGTGLYPYTNGKYRIEISQDGDEWNIDYTSKQAEASTTYTPANTTRFIRCTLLSDTNLLLDTISVIIITDADALATDVSKIHTDITTINTGIEGIEGHLQTTDETIAGVANGALLYQTPFTWASDRQTAIFRAVVYKSGQDATAEFPDRWFSWWLRTEDGEEKMQDGKTFSVSKSQLGFGATVVGRFNTYETKNLTTRNGNPLTTRSGAYLQIYAE